MACEQGISFTEFSYMLLQANDYLLAARPRGLRAADRRLGPVGQHPLRRRSDPPAPGRQRPRPGWPLLTAADGTKLGKTTGRPDLARSGAHVSPYRFFQHWMHDRRPPMSDACWRSSRCCRSPRSMRSRPSTPQAPGAALGAASAGRGGHHARPRRRRGARGGRGGAVDPVRRADRRGTDRGGSRPVAARGARPSVAPAARRRRRTWSTCSPRPGLTRSKGEARRAIEQGGLYVNNAAGRDGARCPARRPALRSLDPAAPGQKAHALVTLVADAGDLARLRHGFPTPQRVGTLAGNVASG